MDNPVTIEQGQYGFVKESKEAFLKSTEGSVYFIPFEQLPPELKKIEAIQSYVNKQ